MSFLYARRGLHAEMSETSIRSIFDWARLLFCRPLAVDRRGAVALWVGLTAPTLVMAMGMGIEVSDWAAVNVELQRTADAAAIAGAINYNETRVAQTAATHAAHIAQINGAAGTATPTWTAGTNTLTANSITAQIVSGVQNASNIAMKVTVTRTVSLAIGRIFSADPSVTLSASAWAELTPGTATGPPACMLALNGDSTGITTDTDITFSGSVVIHAAGCAIRSDAGIGMNGSVNITTAGVYAGGAISANGSVQINGHSSSNNFSGAAHPNSGQIGDPYAGNATLQNALSAAQGASGPAKNISGSSNVTLNPGTYTEIDAHGSSNITMNPGLYVVNGDISFSGSTNVHMPANAPAGSGVTIISTGEFDTSGSTSIDLRAPTTAGASSLPGTIPGVLFASLAGDVSAFTGSSGIDFAGVIYYPNGTLKFAGSSASGSTGCAEVIAGKITLVGSADLSSGCTDYDLPIIGSVPGTPSIKLVK
jgi:Flp pilus assembly protein TadG